MADEQRKPGTARFTLTEPVTSTDLTVVTPRKFKKDGKEKGEPFYSGRFIFKPDSADLKSLKALCAKIANEKWPGRLQREAAARKAGTPVTGERASQKPLKFPFTDGTVLADEAKEKKKDKEYFRGNVVLTGKSDEGHPPRLSGFENGVACDYEGDARKAASGKFYSGVQVLAQFNLVTYESPELHGVTAYLNMVFTTNKGKRIATGASAAEVFKGYVGTVSQEDPTAGDQFAADDGDAIPF